MSPTPYYRSLAELENSSEFEEFLHREFPQVASEIPPGVSRRRWLQLMGASIALSGVVGCRMEPDSLMPFAVRPANRIPGKPKHFNTTIEVAGQSHALRATSYDGRPTKLDGNPSYAAAGGASTARAQAAVLELYDPDRGNSPREKTRQTAYKRSWDEVDSLLNRLSRKWSQSAGADLCVLCEPTDSPSVRRLQGLLRNQWPRMKWFEYTSLSRFNEVQGAILACGQPVRPQFDVESARVILAVDCDLLGDQPNGLRNALGFARGRNPAAGRMSRLYAVEAAFTTTGVAADHRLALRSRDIAGFLASVAAALHADNLQQPNPETASDATQFLAAVVDDLRRHPGESVIAVGSQQPPEVHALAHRLNKRLDNIGKTVQWLPDQRNTVGTDELQQFIAAAQAGECHTALILGGNPCYDAPGDLPFRDALSKVATRFHLSIYPNETSAACQWYLPLSHALECWGDTRLDDGTYAIGQPLIAPLFESRSLVEFLARLVKDVSVTDELALIRSTSEEIFPELQADQNWHRLVHEGFLANSTPAAVTPELRDFTAPAEDTSWQSAGEIQNGDLELAFTSDASVFDGRFANNAWLQEFPHPLTKLTWGNAAVMSPQTAAALGVQDHDVVKLEVSGRSVELPAYVLPGQATGSVAVSLGYGRTRAGLVGGDVERGAPPIGVDVGPIRTSTAMHFTRGLRITPTGKRHELAATQDHFAIDQVGLQAIDDRVADLVREGTLDEYQQHPDFAQHQVHHPPLASLWTETSYDGHAWGMSIDLNKCTGCNACVIACQAENNVPIVGAEQVRLNREMHWLRVDRYFQGDPEQPQVVTQPVTCQHCENAPCEQVCPVAATIHSDEGLNDMAYNRCIGTRYCGNNCPYKVRRFNFFDYRWEQPAANRDLSHLVLNPEVSVRHRGVMEKCTYCVQRIQNAKITARNEQRPLGPNEIVTACQQACPTQAITFGDLNNPQSDVAQAHADPRAYAMLAELNIKPRTKYLARIRNPHPWLARDAESTHDNHDPHHATESPHHAFAPQCESVEEEVVS